MQKKANKTRNKTPKTYSRCPLDEGREYVLGVLFLVLFALFCIFYYSYYYYIDIYIYIYAYMYNIKQKTL